MSTMVEKKTAIDRLIAVMANPKVQKVLDQLAPQGRGAEWIMASLSALVQEKPEILACTPLSIVRCANLAARLGLPLGSGGVFLIPRNNKVFVDGEERKVLEATPVVDYKALVELILEHPKVEAVASASVYEGDEFDCDLGDTRKPICHRVSMTGMRGETVGAWASIVTKGGFCTATVMSKAEIHSVAKPKHIRNDSPWHSNPSEMERKSVLRRLAKTAPLTARARLAFAVEDAIDAERPWSTDDIPDEVVEARAGSAPALQPPPEKPAALPEPTEPRKQDPPAKLEPMQGGQTAPQQHQRKSATRKAQGQPTPPPPAAAPKREPEPEPEPVRTVVPDDDLAWDPHDPDPKYSVDPDDAEPFPPDDEPEGPESRTGDLQAAIGKLFADLDAAVMEDRTVEDRFQEALEKIGGVENIKTVGQCAYLRKMALKP